MAPKTLEKMRKTGKKRQDGIQSRADIWATRRPSEMGVAPICAGETGEDNETGVRPGGARAHAQDAGTLEKGRFGTFFRITSRFQRRIELKT